MSDNMISMNYDVRDGFVQVPEDDFAALRERLEDANDRLALQKALAREEEYYPGDLARALLEGQSPVRVFRNHRGMTQGELAVASDVTQATISEIESGRKQGSIESLKAIAAALDVDLDELV